MVTNKSLVLLAFMAATVVIAKDNNATEPKPFCEDRIGVYQSCNIDGKMCCLPLKCSSNRRCYPKEKSPNPPEETENVQMQFEFSFDDDERPESYINEISFSDENPPHKTPTIVFFILKLLIYKCKLLKTN